MPDDTRRPLVLRLADAATADRNLVGGKAANLGRAIAHGFRVPDGFCLTTSAYDLLESGDEVDPAARRAAIAAAAVPAPVQEALERIHRELGATTPVAVRSSATAEDLPTASFAGQQDTVLNVVGAEQLHDAVRTCWASLWSDRAVSYRRNVGIDDTAVSMAVVVQVMVDVDAAGVLFTADPLTGRRRRAVIDANHGLGESVVSGSASPDRFVVDTPSATLVERHIEAKRSSVVALPAGGTATVDRLETGSSLTDAEAVDLAALGDEVERAFAGGPQDIEWARDVDGSWWLLQTRPVASLFPLPAEEHDGLRVYISINTIQGVDTPLTPLGVSVLRAAVDGLMYRAGLPLAIGPALRDAAGWLFFDITGAVRSRVGRVVAPRILAFGEARSGRALAGIWDDERLSVVHRSPLPTLRRIARMAAMTRMPVKAPLALARPDAVARRAFAGADALSRELAASHPAEATGFAERVAAVVGRSAPERIRRVVPAVWVGMVLSKLGPAIGGLDDAEAATVLGGVPHNVTTEMDLALWALACEAGRDPQLRALLSGTPAAELAARHRAGTLPAGLAGPLGAFLARFGHRAAVEIDVATPRWRDDPEPLFVALAAYLAAEATGHSPHARHAENAQRATAALDALAGRGTGPGRWRRHVARLMLRRARRLVGLREMPKNYLTIGLGAVREAALDAGRALVADGRLETVDDVFLLTVAEIDDALRQGTAVRDRVAAARDVHERERARRRHPRLLLSDGTDVETVVRDREVTDGTLVGVGASAGVVTATAAVVHDPATAVIEPGQVLVAPSTDPGWTPLFMLAGALVMEMGGPNSHGATVAREYGIPAVVGVSDATTRVTSGATVTVDGSAGAVEVHDEAPAPTPAPAPAPA